MRQYHILPKNNKERITYIFPLPILELDEEIILQYYTLDTPHHLFTHTLDSSLPCDLLQLSNLGLYNRPHLNFRLGLLLRLHPLFNSDNR